MMKYIIRERFFYYDNERWDNYDSELSADVKESYSKAIRKIYEDKSTAFLKLVELQTEHFISQTREYSVRDCESTDSLSYEEQEEFEKLFDFDIHYHDDKSKVKNKLNSTEKMQQLYQFLSERNLHKFELVELSSDLLTIYFLPYSNEYAYEDKTRYTMGWSEEEKLLIYQSNEDSFHSDNIYRWHLINTKNCTRLSQKIFSSSLFQSVLTQYADSFNMKSDGKGEFLEINWDNADDNAINSMNAVLDPPWFIPKQVTVEEFLKIQEQMNE